MRAKSAARSRPKRASVPPRRIGKSAILEIGGDPSALIRAFICSSSIGPTSFQFFGSAPGSGGAVSSSVMMPRAGNGQKSLETGSIA